MAEQIKILNSMDSKLRERILADATRWAEIRGIDNLNSNEVRNYISDLQNILRGLDTKYARTLEALVQDADVSQFARVEDNGVLSRYTKNQASLMELFTALQEGQVEVHSENAERAYFQLSEMATQGDKPSQKAFKAFEKARQKQYNANKKAQLAASKKVIADRLKEFDEDAKAKKASSRKEDMAAYIKWYRSLPDADVARLKKDQKDNKQLIKMKAKENKIRRKLLVFETKKELGVLSDKEAKKYEKLNNELSKAGETKQKFKQDIINGIKEQMSDKFEITEKDRDYAMMRFEQLQLEDFSYTVLPTYVETAYAYKALPLIVNEEGYERINEETITDRYGKLSSVYVPDLQERLDKQAEVRAERYPDQKRLDQRRTDNINRMNALNEARMYEQPAVRTKVSAEEIIAEQSNAEKSVAVETQEKEQPRAVERDEVEDIQNEEYDVPTHEEDVNPIL